jgi:hypothetical protein
MTRLYKITIAIACIWVALYFLGGAVARHYNPDFSNPNNIKAYIVNHIRSRDQAGPTVQPSIDKEIGFTCDKKFYGWNPRTGMPFVDDRSDPEWTRGKYTSPPISDKNIAAYAAVFGVANIKTLPDAFQKLSELKLSRPGSLVVIVSGATGFALGFWRSYTTDPDCGSQVLKEVAGDKTFWRELSDSQPLTKDVGGNTAPASSLVPPAPFNRSLVRPPSSTTLHIPTSRGVYPRLPSSTPFVTLPSGSRREDR